MAEDRGADWFLNSEARIARLQELHARLEQVSDPSRELPDLMHELGQIMDEPEMDRTLPPPTPETRDAVLQLLAQRYGDVSRNELIGKYVQERFRNIEMMGLLDERLTDVRDKALAHLRSRQERNEGEGESQR